MLKTNSIPNLDAFFLIDGHVFANFARAPGEEVRLHMGQVSVPMRPCLEETLERYSFVRRDVMGTQTLTESTQSVPSEAERGERFALWVNHLEDWTLSGSQTLQLMITKPDEPLEVKIGEVFKTRTDDKTPLFLQARLGTHRAQAMLRAIVQDMETDEQTLHKIAFDPVFQGGRGAQGYQRVQVPLPAHKSLEITLEVDYTGYVDDGTGIEPFLFIADVHTGPRKTAHTPPEQCLIPHVGVGQSLPTDGVWISAPLPGTPAPDQTISLRCGSNSESLRLETKAEVRLADIEGHRLMIDSQGPADLSLYVDGKVDACLTVAGGQTPLHLSERHLDGATHTLSLRDASGSVPFWEGQVLVPAILTPPDILQRESAPPFPDAVFAQTPRRYAGLKALLTQSDAQTQTDRAQLAHALETVEGGYEKVRLKPLHFPQVEAPDVSIIIPAHNKVNVTYLALCSLLLAHNRASFEVIVVDDASTDETAHLEDLVSGIRVLHNAEAQRFIRACNAGVAEAKGQYVVLLNNDVEVTAGWLDALIDAFTRFDNVGLVGAKLLYPDGQLQDGGGLIWDSGNPWNYGNRQNPNAPSFCYARQADYLSGAAMMTSRAIWDEVGGLSAYLEPMYFEDTDFAFKVREAGYTTWFVPSSVIYHYEGMTSGTDVSTGFKRFQEINRPKFKRRWAEAFRSFGREGHRPDLEKDRGIVGRVLFVDYTTPQPNQDAGSYAALQEIRLVQSLGYKVSFLPMNMAHLGSYTEELQRMGVEMIYAPFFLTARDYLAQHAADFDAFYLTRYYVARDVLPLIRMHAPEARVLFNNADLHFLREIRAAQAEGDAERLEKARETRDAELRVIEQVDAVLSYNEMEHSVIEAYSEGRANVMRTPWVVDVPDNVPDLQNRQGLSFLGSFRHHPNTEGILWFAREIMPQIASRSASDLFIYGSRMGEDVAALACETIHPVGFVEDVAEAYDKHRVFVAPLRSGAGIKGKVLSALAHGIPCVLSPVAAEGIGLRSGHDCFVAQNVDEWVDAVVRLQEDPALWQSISDHARAYMLDRYSFARGREVMRAVFEAVDLYKSKPGGT